MRVPSGGCVFGRRIFVLQAPIRAGILLYAWYAGRLKPPLSRSNKINAQTRRVGTLSEGLLFSVAGARGIVGKTIDVDVVTRLTLAFCSIVPEGDVVVGRDTRPSGESFTHSVIGAVTATGRDCVDLGVATTPTVEMMTENLGAAAGVIITASHNPVQWNALKFLDHRGIFITKDVSDEVYEVFESRAFELADARGCGRVKEYAPSADDHIRAILDLEAVDPESIASKNFKVVVDCINGAGSVIVPRLLTKLGVSVVELNCTPNGDFYRDPEPRPENLQDLADRVRREGADLGMACDPDADRLALVDGQGTAVSEEYTLALAVDGVLSRTPGPVVVNLSTSSVVDHIARKYAVDVYRTPVGEAHVVDLMLRKGAIIGGEGNGGVIYPALHPGRDAPLGMALILQLLADRGASLRDQLDQYPPIFIKKEKVALEGRFSPEIISRLAEDLEPVAIDARDGVKASFDDGWFHVRVSNTEGIVRVITESSTEERSLDFQTKAREVLQASWSES
jgi:phosphomannomutase